MNKPRERDRGKKKPREEATRRSRKQKKPRDKATRRSRKQKKPRDKATRSRHKTTRAQPTDGSDGRGGVVVKVAGNGTLRKKDRTVSFGVQRRRNSAEQCPNDALKRGAESPRKRRRSLFGGPRRAGGDRAADFDRRDASKPRRGVCAARLEPQDPR